MTATQLGFSQHQQQPSATLTPSLDLSLSLHTVVCRAAVFLPQKLLHSSTHTHTAQRHHGPCMHKHQLIIINNKLCTLVPTSSQPKPQTYTPDRRYLFPSGHTHTFLITAALPGSSYILLTSTTSTTIIIAIDIPLLYIATPSMATMQPAISLRLVDVVVKTNFY